MRPTANYRTVTGGFPSARYADLYAAVRSTVNTTARQGPTPATLSAML